jgi:hypothetical protein
MVRSSTRPTAGIHVWLVAVSFHRRIRPAELNARKDQPVEPVIVRSGQEPIVVNLDIPSPEDAPDTPQNDAFHSAPESAERASSPAIPA